MNELMIGVDRLKLQAKCYAIRDKAGEIHERAEGREPFDRPDSKRPAGLTRKLKDLPSGDGQYAEKAFWNLPSGIVAEMDGRGLLLSFTPSIICGSPSNFGLADDKMIARSYEIVQAIIEQAGLVVRVADMSIFEVQATKNGLSSWTLEHLRIGFEWIQAKRETKDKKCFGSTHYMRDGVIVYDKLDHLDYLANKRKLDHRHVRALRAQLDGENVIRFEKRYTANGLAKINIVKAGDLTMPFAFKKLFEVFRRNLADVLNVSTEKTAVRSSPKRIAIDFLTEFYLENGGSLLALLDELKKRGVKNTSHHEKQAKRVADMIAKGTTSKHPGALALRELRRTLADDRAEETLAELVEAVG